jgi:hypothetical protein
MDPKPTPVTGKYKTVRGVVFFLAVLLFVPQVKQSIENIKLFKWHDGYLGLWQMFVIISLIILLPALIFDRNEKIEIPFFKKFFNND